MLDYKQAQLEAVKMRNAADYNNNDEVFDVTKHVKVFPPVKHLFRLYLGS
jgi:hypothetical protein